MPTVPSATAGRQTATRFPLTAFSAPISLLSHQLPLTRWRRSTNILCAPLVFKGFRAFSVIPGLFFPLHGTSWTTRISDLVLSTSLRTHNNFGRVSIYPFSFSPLANCGPAELEDILHLPTDPTLLRLDSTLKRFTSFCASYHGAPFHNPRLPHECFISNMQQSNTFKLRCSWSIRVSSCSSQSCLFSTRKGCVIIL